MKSETKLRCHYKLLSPALDERGRRIWAATEAASLGRGGISLVSRSTGISRTTIYARLRKLGRKGKLAVDPEVPRAGRVRQKPVEVNLWKPERLSGLPEIFRAVDPLTRSGHDQVLRGARILDESKTIGAPLRFTEPQWERGSPGASRVLGNIDARGAASTNGWMEELASLRKSMDAHTPGASSSALDEVREDRW